MDNLYQNNIKSRLRGTHRFLLAKEADETTQWSIPYRDLGNIPREGITYTPSNDKFEDESMIGGEAVVEDIEYIKQMTSFDVRINELTLPNLALITRAEDAQPISQAALANQALTPLDFTADDVEVGKWYTPLLNGEPVFRPTGLAITNSDTPAADLVEGEDYVYTPDLFQIRFLKADKVNGFSVNINVTSNIFSATPIEVQKASKAIKGMGMLRTYVKKHDQKEAALLWQPFGCIIDYEEALNIVVEQNVNATLKVNVTTPRPRILDLRS